MSSNAEKQMETTRELPRMVVGALRGGSGKTTITLGILQALKDRGVKAAPFKKGPDYIDPFWHSEAAGHPCRNLDPYMMDRSQIEKSFGFFSRCCDAALVEGNRGFSTAWMPTAPIPPQSWPNGWARLWYW